VLCGEGQLGREGTLWPSPVAVLGLTLWPGWGTSHRNAEEQGLRLGKAEVSVQGCHSLVTSTQSLDLSPPPWWQAVSGR
jgi:hypothetical protein